MTGSGKELVPVSRPVGRPRGQSKYGPDVEEEIIERLIQGATLISICYKDRDGYDRQRGEFPDHAAVYDWAEPTATSYRPDFALRFARARLAQQRYWLDEAVDIANNTEIGLEEVREHSEKNGVSIKRAYKDMIHHRALKIDTRLKVIARMNPQLWAERLQAAAPAPQPDPNVDLPAHRIVVEGGLPDDPEDGPPPVTT